MGVLVSALMTRLTHKYHAVIRADAEALSERVAILLSRCENELAAADSPTEGIVALMQETAKNIMKDWAAIAKTACAGFPATAEVR